MKPNEILYTLHCFAHIFGAADPEKTWTKVWEVGIKFNVPKENLAYIHQQLEGKINFINVPVPQTLTPNQRIAIATSGHLFAAVFGCKDHNHQTLTEIRNSLKLSHFFGAFVMEKASRAGVLMLISDKPFYYFFDPPDEIAKFIIQVTRMALNEGHGVKKRCVHGLMPQEYEHPFDRKALDSLNGTPGVEKLTKKIWEYGLERIFRMENVGSYIKVTSQNLPHVYYAVQAVCETLQITKIPEIFVQAGWVNAYTTCTENPIVVISSGVCSLTYDEIIFILGHELGHIKSEHVLYHDLAKRVIPYISAVADIFTLGLSKIVSTGLEYALLYWVRQSEFTADRAGLLACQNLEAAIKCMMKIAGYPPRFYQNIDAIQFLSQSQEFESFDADKLNKVAKVITIMEQTHPWTVMRCAEMKRWYDSGEYFRVLNRNTPSP